MTHEKAIAALAQSPAKGRSLSAALGGFSGIWKNQYKSTADFTINGSIVTGTYTNNAGQVISAPITGSITADIISFSALWPTQPEAITTWIGQFVDINGVATLKTLWYLAHNIPDAAEPTGLWTSVLAGADDFTQ